MNPSALAQAATPAQTLDPNTTLGAVIVFLLIFAAAGRWVWSEWKKQTETDRAWREAQNAKREAHEEKQALSWQSVIDSMDQRHEKSEEARQAAILKLAESVNAVVGDLKAHDQQAKTILTTVNEINANTRPGAGQPPRQGNGWGKIG